MSKNEFDHMRWSTYFLRKGDEFSNFWKSYLSSKKDVLFVISSGFDPRMCTGIEELLKFGGDNTKECIKIEIDEGESSPSRKHGDLIAANNKKLESLIPPDKIKTEPVQMWSADRRRRIGSRQVANIFDLPLLIKYSDIVIDISAMPKGIYFPIIGKILNTLDNSTSDFTPNLHVIVSENVKLDSKITDEEIDESANYMHGFTGTLENESTANLPKVWIPILGEKQNQQLDRIYTLVDPDEICPMLPMPSVVPRRNDNLLLEHREFLFDTLRVESRNFIHVAEQNPFEVYREIHKTVKHYNLAFETLGGCKVVISPLSSKLLSIGALLAAYELKNKGQNVGIAYVEANGYSISGDITTESMNNELSTMWLTGDCYVG